MTWDTVWIFVSLQLNITYLATEEPFFRKNNPNVILIITKRKKHEAYVREQKYILSDVICLSRRDNLREELTSSKYAHSKHIEKDPLLTSIRQTELLWAALSYYYVLVHFKGGEINCLKSISQGI